MKIIRLPGRCRSRQFCRVSAHAVLALSVCSCLAQSNKPTNFEFTAVDLKLLEESNAVDRRFENRGLIFHDALLERHLAEIAAPLLPKDPPDRVRWQFRILREPMVNAFALPNGSVYVNTGLIARAENDDQLAAVLAHEATHVNNRHSYFFNRSMRRQTVALEISRIAIAPLPGGGIWGATVTAAAGASEVAAIFSMYGYSQAMERDADLQGLQRLKSTGRDARQIVRFFSIMDERLEPQPVPYIWRDHPRNQQRIAYLKEALGIAADVPAGADADYPRRMRPVFIQNIRLDLDCRAFRSAAAGAARLVDSQPHDAEALYWLAESYRSLGPRKLVLDAAELTDSGQRKAYRKMVRATEQEEAAALAKTPEGKAALETNQRQAGNYYHLALEADSTFAEAHIGLGILYQDQNNSVGAIAEYRKYLDLAPHGPDRERVERRLAELSSKGGSR